MKLALICFTRVPKPGRTKTRLMGLLSPDQCVELHTAFLRDLAVVYDKMATALYVAYTDDPDWAMLGKIFPGAADFFPQEGETLGDKMANAIAHVLSLGFDAVMLTGADLPLMTAGHLESGFEALKTADIAIGPTVDGGYYLIGMKQSHPEVFRVPGYGGSTVYENTLAAIRGSGLTVQPALPCADVDTPEDLKNCLKNVDPGSETGKLLRKWSEEGMKL